MSKQHVEFSGVMGKPTIHKPRFITVSPDSGGSNLMVLVSDDLFKILRLCANRRVSVVGTLSDTPGCIHADDVRVLE